jgi:hypothetical protein
MSLVRLGRIWMVNDRGQSLGPFTREEIAGWVYDGSISPEAQVWAEGEATWRPVAAIMPRVGPAQIEPQVVEMPVYVPVPTPARRPAPHGFPPLPIQGRHPSLDRVR